MRLPWFSLVFPAGDADRLLGFDVLRSIVSRSRFHFCFSSDECFQHLSYVESLLFFLYVGLTPIYFVHLSVGLLSFLFSLLCKNYLPTNQCVPLSVVRTTNVYFLHHFLNLSLNFAYSIFWHIVIFLCNKIYQFSLWFMGLLTYL